MDQGRTMLNNIFGRASSPPINQSNTNSLNNNPNNNLDPRQQQQQQQTLEDIFRSIPQSSPPQQLVQPVPGSFPTANMKGSQQSQTSSFQSPSSGPGISSASSTPVSSEQSDTRQNALLTSLLGTVSSPPSSNKAPPPQAPGPQMGKGPSPPSQASQATASPPSTESQGRVLLEQIMSSGAKQPDQSTLQQQQQQQQYSPFSPPQVPVTSSVPPSISQPQPRVPSPHHKNQFDFVSPFDILASAPLPPSAISSNPANAGKRKPVPGPTGQGALSSGDESALSNPQQQQQSSLDGLRNGGDKRKSVENLMDTIARNAPPPPPANPPSERPQGLSSRSASEVRAPARQPQGANQGEMPAYPQSQISRSMQPSGDSQTPTPSANKSDAATLSDPSSGWRSSDPKPKQQAPQSRDSTREQHPQHEQQTIFFDVSQPLESIQAPPESSLSTPIALVKVEPTFLPGSTIGATSWIAYAMTRGRVRVISRASGDRTLLQLPPSFPSTTSVVDMAVFGNRLAGVTSDGGFVIWELPSIITDDVPGKLLLCVVPPPEPEALRSVRWHPKQPDTVAVASESKIFLLNINEAARRFGTDPVAQNDLSQVGPVINLSSPLVAFAFDVPHLAIATISEDSNLELWAISNQLPFWSAHIPGEAMPSSIDFLDGGIVVGRKNGTIFQLLSVMSDLVLSTLKFIDTQAKDDNTPTRDSMFGHVAYDSRIRTLWIANSRRESLIAVKVAFETTADAGNGHPHTGGYFEQIAEFIGPKPSIHFVILTADSDPHGDEAHAACVASKVPPGPLAVVAFSVHASGVDQIIVRQEWFDNALMNAGTKFPIGVNPFQTPPPTAVAPVRSAPVNFGQSSGTVPSAASNTRGRSPPLEDLEGDVVAKDEGRTPEKPRAKGNKGTLAKEKDEPPKELKEKEKNTKAIAETSALGEPPNGTAWSKDLRRLEESMHTRLGRTLSKELEKQYARIEEGRAADQGAEVARQQHIIKLISNELTKNTTRVVEQAVKTEVTNSVLPALETITRNEIKNALNGQITKGLNESLKVTLPNEIERLLLRPDVSNHVARNFSAAVTPIIERHVKETITKTLIPAYATESNAMHQDLTRELHSELLSVKKEVITWQSEALRGQETIIRDLEQAVRGLQEQVKFLSINSINSAPPVPAQHNQHLHQHRASPVHATSPHSNITGHLPRGNISAAYNQPQAPYGQASAVNPAAWYPGSQVTPLMPQMQAQTQAAIPASTSNGSQQDTQKEDWDENYLAVLATQDPRQLRELLARSNPDSVMPLDGTCPLSQAVVLTLIHRLSAAVGETSPVEEAFKASLWWLQRAANTLNPNDPLISPYVARVLPNVQAMLNTTKSRLSLLPGGPPLLEASRIITEVQDIVARKTA